MQEECAEMRGEEVFTNYYSAERVFDSGDAEGANQKPSAYFFCRATFFLADAAPFRATGLSGNTRAKILSMFLSWRFRSKARSIFARGTRPPISGSFRISSRKSRFSFHARMA